MAGRSLARNHLSSLANKGRFGDTEIAESKFVEPGALWHVTEGEKKAMNMYGQEGEQLVAAVGSGIAEEVLRNYTVGRIFGMDVYESGNISIDGSDDAKGACFAAGNGGGLVLVTSKEWDVSPERDESLRATELNVVGEYAVGEYLASWIVTLYADASDPA